MSKKSKHYLSLIISFVATLIDYLNSNVHVSPLILVGTLVIIIVVYYIIVRMSIAVYEIVSRIFKTK